MRVRAITPALLVTLGVESAVCAQGGYTFRNMPASIQEIDIGFRDRGDFSEQVDVQSVTQGADWATNRNPFAYPQRFHVRPWLQYHKFGDLVLAFSASYLKFFAIEPVSVPESDEVRVTTMATYTQKRSWGAWYEQGRFEIRNTEREGAHEWVHIPRVRARFGQTFNVPESSRQARIGVYQEVILRRQDESTGLDIIRLFGAYAFDAAPKWIVTLGIRAQWQRKPGRVFDVLVGPSMAARYQWGRTSRPPPHPDADPD